MIIDRNGEKFIESDVLHEVLKLKTRHNDWIRRRFKGVSMEGEVKKEYRVVGGANKTIKFIPISLAKAEIINTKEVINNCEALELLCEIDSLTKETTAILKRDRKEIKFGELLEKVTGVSWRKQVNVLGYRLDFVFHDYIIVEYDEKYHERQVEKDNKRMEEILKYATDKSIEYYNENTTPVFIRVKEGEEGEGINKIIETMLEFDIWRLEKEESEYVF